jgi:hypothetical protein
MQTFNIDFSGDELSRKVGQRMKDQLAHKLMSAGLADRVKLTFTENEHGVPVNFHLEGSSVDIAKAKEALGIDWERVENDSKEP